MDSPRFPLGFLGIFLRNSLGFTPGILRNFLVIVFPQGVLGFPWDPSVFSRVFPGKPCGFPGFPLVFPQGFPRDS